MSDDGMSRREFLLKSLYGMGAIAFANPLTGGNSGYGKKGYASPVDEKTLEKLKDFEIFSKIFDDFVLKRKNGQSGPMEIKVDYLRDGTENDVVLRIGGGGSYYVIEVPRHSENMKGSDAIFEEFYITGFPEGKDKKIKDFGTVKNPNNTSIKDFLIDVYKELEKTGKPEKTN